MAATDLLDSLAGAALQNPTATIGLFVSSLAAIIAALAAIASWRAADATHRTVQEMEETRKELIKPDLIALPPTHKYSLRWEPGVSTQIVSAPMLKEGELIVDRSPSIRLANVGRGAAKRVRLRWTWLGDEIEKVISNSAMLRPFRPKLQDGFVTLETRNDTGRQGWSSPCASEALSEITAILPAESMSDTVDALMPVELTTLVELSAVDSPAKAAFLRVETTYQDSDGEEFTRHFTVRITPWSNLFRDGRWQGSIEAWKLLEGGFSVSVSEATVKSTTAA